MMNARRSFPDHSQGTGILTLTALLLLITAILHAANPPISESQKIETLIKYVGEMNEAKFVRNGTVYDAKTAATFLRQKWGAGGSTVKTARDFIDKVASISSTSGKPYLIRFKDGSEIKTRELLLAKLAEIENQR